MRASVVVACLLLGTGCYRDSPTNPGPIDQVVTLAPGQAASIEGTNLSVRFEAVTGDSRCPADALCILGGSATVKVGVAIGSREPRGLTFETGDLEPVTVDSWTVHLVQLAPYPFSALPIRHEDYRATLRVTHD